MMATRAEIMDIGIAWSDAPLEQLIEATHMQDEEAFYIGTILTREE